MKGFIVSFGEKVLLSFGLELISSWRLVRLGQTKYLKRLFGTYDIDCVFDVGANEGQYGLFLRREVGFRGQIISFEPFPEAFEKVSVLAKQFGPWTCFPYALGSVEGEADFNLTKNSEFGSLLKFKTSELVVIGDNAEQVGQAKVTVRRLDALFRTLKNDFDFKNPYLKIDTQGFDRHVIEGAGDQLSNFLALQSEASVVALYEDSPSYAELISFVNHKGFYTSAFYPNNEGHFPKLLEFDCHFIREGL